MKTKGAPKTGGRIAGTPNKTTTDMRNRIQNLVDANWKTVSKDMKKLPPKDRMEVITKLLPYITPKLQVTDLNIDFDRISDDQLDSIVNLLIEKIE